MESFAEFENIIIFKFLIVCKKYRETISCVRCLISISVYSKFMTYTHVYHISFSIIGSWNMSGLETNEEQESEEIDHNVSNIVYAPL